MAGSREGDTGSAARKTGQMYFGNPLERCGCRVLHLTNSEAIVESVADAAPPRELRLISAALRLDQPCVVAWRAGRKFGLKFAT